MGYLILLFLYFVFFLCLTFNFYCSIQSENRYDHSERRVTKLERDIERLEGRKKQYYKCYSTKLQKKDHIKIRSISSKFSIILLGRYIRISKKLIVFNLYLTLLIILFALLFVACFNFIIF